MAHLNTARIVVLLSAFLCLFPMTGQGSESGSRAYANVPTGINVVQLVYNHSRENGSHILRSNAGALYYYRYVNFLGKNALVGGYIPYANVRVSFPASTLHLRRTGMGDPTLVIGMDFFGAPALSRKEFKHYRQNLIIGGSLQVSAPLGQYDAASGLNIGSNRWSFRPELAISKAIGDFVIDFFANYQSYTDNKHFRSGLVKSQRGKWGIENHLSYTVMRGMWISADYLHTWGGETTVNGINRHDSVRDSTIGITINKVIFSGYSMQSKYRHDTVSQNGNKTRSFTLKFQYVW